MRFLVFALLLLAACESGAIKLGDTAAVGTDSAAGDTAGPPGDDSGGNDDTGTEPVPDCVAYGLVAEEELVFADGTNVDGWSSDRGAYGGANSQQDSLLAVNASGACVAEVGGTIIGELWLGAGADPDSALCYGWSGSISGSVEVLRAAVPVEIPAAPAAPPAGGALGVGFGETLEINGDLHVPDFTVEFGGAVEVSDSVLILVDGDLKIEGAPWSIRNGETVDLYVTGNVRFGWGAQVNTDGLPAQLRIHMLGGDLVMDSGSHAAAVVRTGEGGFSNNGGQFYGSWSGARLDSQWGAAFHLDEASVCP